MIKKLLFLYIIVFFSLAKVLGQDEFAILKDDNSVSTFWLNNVTFYELPNVEVGAYYSHSLQIKIPKDTISTVGNRVLRVKIKDIKVLSILNVPEGLSYSHSVVNKSDKDYFLFTLDLYGRALSDPKNLMNARLSTTLSVDNGKSIVRTYDVKNISVISRSRNTFETFSKEIGLKSLQYYPDPISNTTEVSFWSSKLQLVEFEVRDAIGNLKFKKTFTAKVGSNKVSFSQNELPNGLYLYSIRSDDQVLAKRLIVK